MPVTIQHITNEPIIIAKLVGRFDPSDLETLSAQLSREMREVYGPVYRIADMSETEAATLPEIMALLKELRREDPLMLLDQEIVTVFIGEQWRARQVKDVLRHPKNGGLQLPVFTNMGEAMIFTRFDRKRFKAAPVGHTA
jgi:hypothetical protein